MPAMVQKTNGGGGLVRLVLLVSLVMLTAPRADADRTLEEALVVVAAGADLASTEIAIARGAEETNPLGQERWQRIALKSGVTVGILALARKLGDDRGKWIRLTTMGVWFGATGWNISVTLRTP